MRCQEGIQVVLVNLVSGVVSGEAIAKALMRSLTEVPHASTGVQTELPQVVCRWAGPDFDRAAEILALTPICLCEELDTAISQAFRWVKLQETTS